MTRAPSWRARLDVWVESPRIQRLIIALVIVNAITLGLETVPGVMAMAGGWSLFDVAVIAIALVPAAGPLSVFRALRVLRILRLVSVVPRLRAVVEALARSLPGMGAIALLLGIFFYVFAVVATKLFGADFPHWFGSLWTSMFSLFQIMTLEAWSEIARTVMERYPAAWLFFIAFILLATFTVLNLFIALIVKAMEDPAVGPRATRGPDDPAPGSPHAAPEDLVALRAEIAALRREFAGLAAQLHRSSGWRGQ